MSSLFFFQGKGYETFEEFIEASYSFYSKQINYEDVMFILNIVARDLLLNVETYEIKLSNGEFNSKAAKFLFSFLSEKINYNE